VRERSFFQWLTKMILREVHEEEEKKKKKKKKPHD
jgi:hypothetical protein